MKRIIKIVAIAALMTPMVHAADGADLLKACAGCHGADFSKKALGKSKDVSKMDEAAILASLKGYKDGTYGGAMKGMMKGQVATKSDEDMAAMAKAIVALSAK